MAKCLTALVGGSSGVSVYLSPTFLGQTDILPVQSLEGLSSLCFGLKSIRQPLSLHMAEMAPGACPSGSPLSRLRCVGPASSHGIF